MTEAINRTHDSETKLLVKVLNTYKALNEPLKEKWLDYGTGLAEGYKLAKRHEEPKKEA